MGFGLQSTHNTMQDQEETKPKVSTEPYKGVRDFYPEDMFVLKHIFSVMRKTVEQFGYVEYGGSILEPTELYRSKTSDEIVRDQTYSFKDRGDRDVTLRPEMTPTVTRMVAAKKRELAFPLRWYSIPNLFRYEKPQRGRLREHFQLNVDLFGVDSIQAELEVITVASNLLQNFGAAQEDFVIKINNRKMLTFLLTSVFKLHETDAVLVTRLIDRKNKMSSEEFTTKVKELVHEKLELFETLLITRDIHTFISTVEKECGSELLGGKDTEELISTLKAQGLTNIVFDPTLARGFDYYTGIVFEIFDTNIANPRALFGGGRFDDLLSVFGSDNTPAVGFGAGDVTISDFLETHNLMPAYSPTIDLALCVISKENVAFAITLAHTLRERGLRVAVEISLKKISSQIQWADKQKIPYIICIGEQEEKTNSFTVKELETGKEVVAKSVEEIKKIISVAP
jgi:histidyl-tRNA synthetase